jgi:hypothetical protein
MTEYYVQWWNDIQGAWVTSEPNKPLSKQDALAKCSQANMNLPPLGMRRRVVAVTEVPVPKEVQVRYFYNMEGWSVIASFPYLPEGWKAAEELYFERVAKNPNDAHNYDVKEIY